MADGLAGHLYDFYPFVKNSPWLHPQGSNQGQDYSSLNEALPYWLNGLVPLAYQLNDHRLKVQVQDVARKVLEMQSPDGWIGPEAPGNRNFWGRTPFILGLTQMVEADKTCEAPVVNCMRRYFRLMNAMLHDGGTGYINGPEPSWGQARAFDTIMTIQWLIERYPSNQDELLWDNMRMLDDLNMVRWEKWYGSEAYPKVVVDPQIESPIFPFLHGVNVAQGKSIRAGRVDSSSISGLKASAVAWRMRPSDTVLQESERALRLTFDHHGAPSGTMLADELQRNRAPWMGSELCMAVETGYSMAYMYLSLGLNEYADRAETVIFNALPAAFTDDYWGHQYMTQPNQPWAKFNAHDIDDSQPKLFTTAQSGVANTFGLEPQYPCCTVNYPQGWPKFVGKSWGRMGANGLAHILLGPSVVSTIVKDGQLSVSCETNYPFGNTLIYKVKSNTECELYVRVPSWYVHDKSLISVNGGRPDSLSPNSKTGLHQVKIPAGESTITYVIGTKVCIEPRSNGAVSIHHGNLLYALEISSSTVTAPPHHFNDPRGPPYADFPFSEIKDSQLTNMSPWNVAIDPSTISYFGIDSTKATDLCLPVFAQSASPTYMTVKGCEVEWPLYLDATPDWAPKEPKCTGSVKEYRLIPYGGAKLHMSELPVVKLD